MPNSKDIASSGAKTPTLIASNSYVLPAASGVGEQGNKDQRRALNTLRYIHANPKAAGIQPGFFYDFSNYGTYDRLGDDGLTEWHPAFLKLGKTLDECARKYRGFCKKYKPQPKPEKRYHRGSKLLPKLKKGKGKKSSPGQTKLPWAEWEASDPEIVEVAEKFVLANCYDPKVAMQWFEDAGVLGGGNRGKLMNS